ncbi:MAG: serine/threonine protein kinase, partial [Phycisphaeraceae bacterium]|nr:serine/threonine protein kinase [Phycisphaeraceae bacterium]
MEPKQTCSECGNPMEAGALTGLCPACMMQVGLGSVETNPAFPKQSDTQPFAAPSVQELAGLFPQLEIQALIGVGGMGAVYKAHQRDLDRPVALKILVPRREYDPGFAERFMREARALARLNHPHIVAVYDFGHKDQLNYFIMEFVDGPNLRQVQKAGEMSPNEALAIIPQICEALQFAHNEGVVHRDIKPENVLLDQKGRVKIADFGLAKIVGKQAQNLTLTQEGHVMGTPHYMAPEQVEHPHEVDHRADIYSLGVVFYEMLTGELPLGKFAPPSCKVQVDVRLDEVVLKTLEKEPGLRYQQVSQVATEVQTISTTPQETRSETSAQAEAMTQAAHQLRGPGIGLIVTGLLEWILVPLGILAIALFGG